MCRSVYNIRVVQMCVFLVLCGNSSVVCDSAVVSSETFVCFSGGTERHDAW